MNKPLIITFCLTILYSVGFSQTACQNFEKAKQIKANAGLEHSGTLKQIVLYWSKRCACESGAITGGTWDYTVEVANRVYDNYQSGNLTKDYSGPSFPVPDRRLSVGDCKNNTTSTSSSASFDCNGNTFDKSKDPQQYGNAYMLARCECENGVPNEERARQLEAQMKINYQNCQTYYGNTLGMPAPLSWSECKILEMQNNTSNTINYNNKRIVKDEYLDLLNDLAAGSNNPHFKNMVKEMNDNRDAFAQGRNIAMQFGSLSQQDLDTYNMFENISQGIAIGKFLVKELSNALTPEQQQARDYIQNLYKELYIVYNEVSYVPTFYTYDDNMLQKINNIKTRIGQYERATAVKRLLYFKYWNQKPYMTIAQLQQTSNEIVAIANNQGTQAILDKISLYEKPYIKDGDLIFNPVLNKKTGFKNTYIELKMQEANYYEKQGNKEKANKIRASIDYDANNFTAFKLLHKSFNNKNYFGSKQYYSRVKNILKINENKEHFFVFYSNIPDINFEKDGLRRIEATYLLALGVLSYAYTNDYSQAQEELQFLKWYNENHRKFNEYYKTVKARKKAGRFTDVEYAHSYSHCLVIEKTVNAYLLAKYENNKEDALNLINEAIELLNENPTMFNYYDMWVYITRLDILIKLNMFDEARKQASTINKSKYLTTTGLNINLFDIDDYYFLMALMKYKQKQYQSCLNQLKILEKTKPNSNRLLLLKRDTYLKLGNTEMAKETEKKLLTE